MCQRRRAGGRRWAAALLGLLACSGPPPAPPVASGRLPQRAFVWQRAWTPALEAAVRGAGAGAAPLDGLVVLAAEVEADGRTVATDALNGDHAEALRAAPRLSLAVRAAALPADPAAEAALLALLTATVRAAEDQGLDLRSLHLDIDVPTARLAEYAALVARLSAALAPTPIEVLALPTWLGAPGLPPLQRAADRLVLQVHGLDPGPVPGAPPVLFSTPAALQAISALAAEGLPFQVALPTHSYAVSGPAGPTRLRAEPAELAPLVADWVAQRPAALEGLCWFRLPVAGDPGTWTPDAFAAVRAGRAPSAPVELRLNVADNGLSVDIFAEATGEDEGPVPAFALRLPAGEAGPLLPGDAWLGGRWRIEGPGALSYSPDPAARVAPGAARRLGFVALPAGGGPLVMQTLAAEAPVEAPPRR